MSKKISLVILVLFISGLACGLPTSITNQQPQIDLAGTSAALANTAQALQNAQAAQPAIVNTTPQAPAAPAIPSDTPTITPTPTLAVPMISVTTNTNCRMGPLPDYPIMGALTVGQLVELKGKNQSGDWWYISNPQKPGEFCWVWGQYAQIQGDTAPLPIVTPPPTFTIQFAGINNCPPIGSAFIVKNLGSNAYKSGTITVVDLDAGGNPPFTPRIDNQLFMPSPCAFSASTSTLAPGTSAHVISSLVNGGTLPPTGHKMKVEIMLCSESNQGGSCLTRTLNFTMP